MSFTTKLTSEILDYALHFELVQFQYDRWLYKVVSGAINTARRLKCSPARALDTKLFSPTFWQWQHRFLLDAVDQFGLPDVFITLSPYEWSFPFPAWIEDVRLKTGNGPTNLAGYETAHIVHVLTQVVRGYLCGSNSQKWSNHLFNYNRLKSRKNVKTYFYRFEFQKRGTVHLHLLVWLQDISKTEYQHIRADIPNDHPEISYLANKHQRSDKASSSLKLQTDDSFLENKDGKQLLRLKHPADAFAVNLRAYIATLLPALQCSMDFQTTDGRAMLLSYVTSYVTKWQDGIGTDALYAYHVSGGQAAIRYVMDIKPAEPEMWLALSSTKIAWSSSRTKRYAVPLPDTAVEQKTAEKYRNRPTEFSNYSLLQWLRMLDTDKAVPKVYKAGTTLVGLKLVSFFNKDYFFQYFLLHLPHTRISELQHPNHENIPLKLQWYAAAVQHCGEFWQSKDAISSFLHDQGNREHFIQTALAYVDTLKDMFFLWQLQVLSVEAIDMPYESAVREFSLDPQQLCVHRHVVKSLNERASAYSSFLPSANTEPASSSNSESNSDFETDMENEQQVLLLHGNFDHPDATTNDWTKPILVTGKPGCGKSHAIESIVHSVSSEDALILIAAPTGFLASVFRFNAPEHVVCDTVHASFHFPVETDVLPKINWELSKYDLIIIDEISMIPDIIFNHILKTFNVLLFRPVVLLSGDAGQQQPFTREKGRIMQLNSAFDNRDLLNNCYHYNLQGQHRVGDEQYLSFLNTIRQWVPTQQLLDQMQNGRIISEGDTVTDEDIIRACNISPDITILTFTKNATNHINQLIANTIFRNSKELAIVQLDCDLPPIPIYFAMRVVISQNRDKVNGVVNGQLATIDTVHNATVFLKLTTGKVVAIYQVTTKKDGISKTVYTFCLAYATTMCKAQGQTLARVVLWFDIDNIPPGTAYVALSRVRRLDDIFFLNRLQTKSFIPVTRLPQLL